MLSFFPRDVLDENWDLIESVSEGFPTSLRITDRSDMTTAVYRVRKTKTLQQNNFLICKGR